MIPVVNDNELEIIFNEDSDGIEKKIMSLEKGYRSRAGIFYSGFSDGKYFLLLNGRRGNSFSPVLKFEISGDAEKGSVVKGKFYYRKFTVNFLYLWFFGIVLSIYISMRNIFLNWGSPENFINSVYCLMLSTIFLVLLFSVSRKGSGRFAGDMEEMTIFLRDYVTRIV